MILIVGMGMVATGYEAAAESCRRQWDRTFGSPGIEGASVFALTAVDSGTGFGKALFAGGDFAKAGGVGVANIAEWNGRTWSPLGGGTNESVLSLAFWDDGTGGGTQLYAGGFFYSADGRRVYSIAQWDGTSWSDLAGGLFSRGQTIPVVATMTSFDDGMGGRLYVGGGFDRDQNNTVRMPSIGGWDGVGWSHVGDGDLWNNPCGDPNVLYVNTLAATSPDSTLGNLLYVGGAFTTAGDMDPANLVAQWDGYSWASLGGGITGDCFISVNAMAVYDDGAGDALYVAGQFQTAGGIEAFNIAKWDGNAWRPLLHLSDPERNGVNGPVYALQAVSEGDRTVLYVGGSFSTAGGRSANNVAQWDGRKWTRLKRGTDQAVYALSSFDDGSGRGPSLYVGGQFNSAGRFTSNRIARWGCP